MKKFIGIDLGSSSTIVYVPKKGIIYNEPTVVAINTEKNKVESYGYLAFKLLGKEQDPIKVVRPVKNGVINDGPAAVKFLKAVLKELKLTNVAKSANIILSCPSEYSQIEQSALRNVARKLDMKNVTIHTSSYLSALGGIQDGAANRAAFICNIGGGLTDMSVLTNGKVIISKSLNFSGKILDDAIIRHLRKNHHLIIGSKTAEYIKMKIGSVEAFPENRLLEVSGIDFVSSLPHSVVISTSEIKSTLTSCLLPLVDALTDCLELIPPEVASELIESGLVISGGCSLLGGLREYLENALNISVRIAMEPVNTVANGMKIVAHQN
jgi:rod shape-determining protein MreB